ncbi:hypothetical protein [Haloferax sp. Atlit-10N]|uniref:hypothetical protein n=1 Tax=Haloferax sp. Atlit-10N TaxID=2077204 RepID=UPI00131500C3|nr:hypothetical protein [Haloferax sp. Atlit-10N]
MRELGLSFVDAGFLFVLHPSAAARYPDNGPDGQQLVRYVAAPGLALLGILLFLETTIQ